MSLDLENLRAKDPFNDVDNWEEDDTQAASLIHLRIQQRNGRKSFTTCQGIPAHFDLKRILKNFKKKFCTNGNLQDDPELGIIIQCQGDKREVIKAFLIEQGIAEEANIKVHGF